jgi:hypothetical protein
MHGFGMMPAAGATKPRGDFDDIAGAMNPLDLAFFKYSEPPAELVLTTPFSPCETVREQQQTWLFALITA